MDKIYDLIIVGGGPAGIAASIYAKRAMLSFLFLERAFPGGEIASTYEVENYPGLNHISGFELSEKMVEHAKQLGVEIQIEEVNDYDFTEEIKKVITKNHVYLTKTVIVATGAHPKSLGVPGEQTFFGRGVSTCATCDGRFFQNMTTVVIGGGDVAIEDAIYLARICKKVYVIHRRNELRAVKALQDKLFRLENVEVIWDSIVTEINGEDTVQNVRVQNKINGESYLLETNGVFIAVGIHPNTEAVVGKLALDESGYIITNENCETSVEGVFAAGDVRTKLLRQVVTGVADGAISVFGAEKYL